MYTPLSYRGCESIPSSGRTSIGQVWTRGSVRVHEAVPRALGSSSGGRWLPVIGPRSHAAPDLGGHARFLHHDLEPRRSPRVPSGPGPEDSGGRCLQVGTIPGGCLRHALPCSGRPHERLLGARRLLGYQAQPSASSHDSGCTVISRVSSQGL